MRGLILKAHVISSLRLLRSGLSLADLARGRGVGHPRERRAFIIHAGADVYRQAMIESYRSRIRIAEEAGNWRKAKLLRRQGHRFYPDAFPPVPLRAPRRVRAELKRVALDAHKFPPKPRKRRKSE